MGILADRLFRFYHEQELAADPQVFLAGVVELFCAYSPEVVERAVSPVFGLPGKFKFPPRLAEIKEFLDDEAAASARFSRYAALPPPKPSQPFSRPSGPSYVELVEKHGRPMGRFEQAGDKWNRDIHDAPKEA